MTNNYVPYHIHSDYSLLDSCTQYSDYIDEAAKNGMTAIAFSEHGKLSGWFKKMQYCKKNNLKYIHAIECYLTRNLDEKIRDNYHTILIAKNRDGLEELNSAVYKSFDSDHFYYVGRITFDEFLSLSDNIITTSACLAGPLNKLDKEDPYYEKLIKRYDFLEIQPHNDEEQKKYNIDLACLSSTYNKPLIAGTDSHSINDYKAKCRKILLKYKGQSYGNEDNFDLTFKNYNELVSAFETQDAIPSNLYLQAIENTNVLADMIEDYQIDTSIKYPILYGTRENDHEKLIELIDRKLNEKISCGAVTADQIDAFKKSIEEEMKVFTKTKMDGFMLSEAELLNWCHDNGIVTGPARGSVGGCRIAYLTDIIDLNPETWHTVFSRFANEDRVEVGDIDVDVIEEDRPKIFNYILSRFGREYCSRVSSFGTIADKAAIDEIGGALRQYYDEEHPNKTDNPYSLENIKLIKKEYTANPEATKEKYKDIFYYYDGMIGTKVSQSVHPAGMVICPIDLIKNFGVFDKDGYNCLFMDMDECHDAGLVKYDFLCLSNVKILKETCELAHEKYPQSYEINWFDENVWNDMLRSSAGIFQMESDFAFQSLTKFKPKSIFDMSLVTACIRPSGTSYRDGLLSRTVHDNGSEVINEMLKDNYGYLVYQEDVIKFLQDVCGFSGSEADTTRRAIAKKKMELVAPMLPKILEGYCNKSPKPREIAEKEASQFLKVIEDASSYMFGYNHSVGYCLIGYLCAYYRYYHPTEFITALLNDAVLDADIQKYTSLAQLYGVTVTSPKYGVSHGNYGCNAEEKIISKGISSIKQVTEKTAEAIDNIHNEYNPKSFVEFLLCAKNFSALKNNQIEALIKIDFFSQFGTCKELMTLLRMFELFKRGQAKSIKKEDIKNQDIANIIGKYTNFGLDKNGRPSASYSFKSEDSVKECMLEIEQAIMNMKIGDVSPKVKIQNYVEYLGYIPSTGEEKDRKTLIIESVSPITGKNGNIWQYRVGTRSLGSGKQSRLSLSKDKFELNPIKANDIIKVEHIEKDKKGYWQLLSYTNVF